MSKLVAIYRTSNGFWFDLTDGSFPVSVYKDGEICFGGAYKKNKDEEIELPRSYYASEIKEKEFNQKTFEFKFKNFSKLIIKKEDDYVMLCSDDKCFYKYLDESEWSKFTKKYKGPYCTVFLGECYDYYKLNDAYEHLYHNGAYAESYPMHTSYIVPKEYAEESLKKIKEKFGVSGIIKK